MITTDNQEPSATENEGNAPQSMGRPQSTTPRIVIKDAIDIDLIREQLENHGRVVIVRNDNIHIPDRSVNLLTRALRVPRVPRTSGPTHFTIPRHIDRAGNILECTEQWDPINWRTRAARPHNTQALLLAKAALRVLPQNGKLGWEEVETALRGHGINGVYEPLAVAMIQQGESIIPRADLYHAPSESGVSSKKASRLLDMAASVFRGHKGGADAVREPIVISDEARTAWTEKLTSMGITGPYIIVAPFGNPAEGVHDWAVERCAEVLRHALEWRGVQSVIISTAGDRGKAERLRIISGNNVAQIACDLAPEVLAAAISGAKATLATPGMVLQTSMQMGISTVCVSGPATNTSQGNLPHLAVYPGMVDGKLNCNICKKGEHSCVEDLEAGPVARAISKVLTAAPATTPH